MVDGSVSGTEQSIGRPSTNELRPPLTPERKLLIGTEGVDVTRDLEHSGADYLSTVTQSDLTPALKMKGAARQAKFEDIDERHPLTKEEREDILRVEEKRRFHTEFNAAYAPLSALKQEVQRLMQRGVKFDRVLFAHGVGRGPEDGDILKKLCKDIGLGFHAIKFRDGYIHKAGKDWYDFEGLAADMRANIQNIRETNELDKDEKFFGVLHSLGTLVGLHTMNKQESGRYKPVEHDFSQAIFASAPLKHEDRAVDPTMSRIVDIMLKIHPIRNIMQHAMHSIAHSTKAEILASAWEGLDKRIQHARLVSVLKSVLSKKAQQQLATEDYSVRKPVNLLRRIMENDNVKFFGNINWRSLFSCYKTLFNTPWNQMVKNLTIPVVATFGKSDDATVNKCGVTGINDAPVDKTTKVYIPNQGHKLPDAEMLMRIILTEQLRAREEGLKYIPKPQPNFRVNN